MDDEDTDARTILSDLGGIAEVADEESWQGK
jgi:hypothetical protein